MTTLSKESVKGIAESLGWSLDEIELGDMADFAEIARADLVAENERLKAIIEKQSDCEGEFCGKCYEQGLSESRTALAAVEAREMKLREALDQVMGDIRSEAFLFDGGNGISADTEDAADNLLNQPRDDSALREMISGVYEECAKVPQSIAEALADTHGHDDMGSLSFGRGDHAEEKLGRYNELMEIADAIRALAEKARHGN